MKYIKRIGICLRQGFITETARLLTVYFFRLYMRRSRYVIVVFGNNAHTVKCYNTDITIVFGYCRQRYIRVRAQRNSFWRIRNFRFILLVCFISDCIWFHSVNIVKRIYQRFCSSVGVFRRQITDGETLILIIKLCRTSESIIYVFVNQCYRI